LFPYQPALQFLTNQFFEVSFSNGYPELYWTTQTETNSLGWNIYRGETESAFQNNQISKCNLGLIPGAGTTSEPTEYHFVDEDNISDSTNYWYWLESISFSGETEYYGPISLINETENEPETFKFGLFSNHPNPFNLTTEISFRLKEKQTVDLSIYNIKGQKVKTLFSGIIENGRLNKIVWDGTDNNKKKVRSGIYFYLLKTANKNYMKKMLLRN
jgi:hypothetical protein